MHDRQRQRGRQHYASHLSNWAGIPHWHQYDGTCMRSRRSLLGWASYRGRVHRHRCALRTSTRHLRAAARVPGPVSRDRGSVESSACSYEVHRTTAASRSSSASDQATALVAAGDADRPPRLPPTPPTPRPPRRPSPAGPVMPPHMTLDAFLSWLTSRGTYAARSVPVHRGARWASRRPPTRRGRSGVGWPRHLEHGHRRRWVRHAGHPSRAGEPASPHLTGACALERVCVGIRRSVARATPFDCLRCVESHPGVMRYDVVEPGDDPLVVWAPCAAVAAVAAVPAATLSPPAMPPYRKRSVVTNAEVQGSVLRTQAVVRGLPIHWIVLGCMERGRSK